MLSFSGLTMVVTVFPRSCPLAKFAMVCTELPLDMMSHCDFCKKNSLKQVKLMMTVVVIRFTGEGM